MFWTRLRAARGIHATRRWSRAKWIKATVAMSVLLYAASLLHVALQWTDLSTAKRQLVTDVDNSPQGELDSHDTDDPSDGENLYPEQVWRPGEFECLGWIATDDHGTPTGNARECWQRVLGGEAGYCEVRNATSGDVYQVMHTTSLSLKEEVRFTCRLAKRFTDFRFLAATYAHDPPMTIPRDLPSSLERGIAMAVYENVLPSAYASIRQLRDLGCRLPIELWSRFDELSLDNAILRRLVDKYGPVSVRFIYDERIHGFYTKVHAVYYSSFADVLLLDADNFAVRDPTFLFDSPQFRSSRAVFWPDFWHPGNTIFNIHAQSPLWELLDMDYVNMLEQESGQVLIDRRANRVALERLVFFATARPNLLSKLMLVWGDKDLFRLAWMQVNAPFYFNDVRLPGSLGVVNVERERFCGMSMAQYDLDGEKILFVHRNTIKLTGKKPVNEKVIWRVLQEYRVRATPPPMVQSFDGLQLFNETSCFGVKRFSSPAQRGLVASRQVFAVEGLAGLEVKLVRYAHDAVQVLNRRNDGSVEG